jgi:hypothetical protein
MTEEESGQGSEGFGKGMGGKGIGTREEEAEEDKQGDGGKAIQNQIRTRLNRGPMARPA